MTDPPLSKIETINALSELSIGSSQEIKNPDRKTYLKLGFGKPCSHVRIDTM